AGGDLVDDPLDDGTIESLLAAEVVRDQRRVRTGRARDRLRRRREISIAAENANAGIDQCIPRRFAAPASRAGGPSGPLSHPLAGSLRVPSLSRGLVALC